MTTLRKLFFLLLVRPLVLIVIGLNVRHRERLPSTGPAIIVANHNSHLDTLVLMSLFPLSILPRLHPVAAMDYFLRTRWLAWFALNVIGILPIPRRGRAGGSVHPLDGCFAALEQESVLILFPEGSRGEPEKMSEFKGGVAHLAERFPSVPVVPVFLHGLGKALPRGEALLVPFFCDVFIGESLTWSGDRAAFMDQLNARMEALSTDAHPQAWT